MKFASVSGCVLVHRRGFLIWKWSTNSYEVEARFFIIETLCTHLIVAWWVLAGAPTENVNKSKQAHQERGVFEVTETYIILKAWRRPWPCCFFLCHAVIKTLTLHLVMILMQVLDQNEIDQITTITLTQLLDELRTRRRSSSDVLTAFQSKVRAIFAKIYVDWIIPVL